MYFRVKVLNTELKDKLFELDREVLTVGRSEENDITIEQASVSRSHAVIECHDGRVTIMDLGSRNKTKVNGDTVLETHTLPAGSVVSIGDVLMSVQFAEDEDELAAAPAAGPVALRESDIAATDEEETPVGGVPVPAADVNRGALKPATAIPEAWFQRQTAPPPVEIKPEAVRSAKMRGWLVLVLAIAAAVTLTIHFARSGGELPPVARDGQQVRIGQKRVTEVPYGFIYSPRITPEGCVKIYRERGMTLFVIVEGLKQGIATVKLYNADHSRYFLLHVKVFPRILDEAEELPWESEMTQDRRAELARKRIVEADALRKTSPYEAMQMYRQAQTLLRDMEGHPLFQRAVDGFYDTEEKIDEQYNKLIGDMAIHIKAGDRRGALQKLAEIKKLIPNEEDWRRQDADLRYRLLQEIIRRREKLERFMQ